MIYLSSYVKVYPPIRSDLGALLTPAMGNRCPVAPVPWGADNAGWQNPDWFDADAYLDWLAKRAPHQQTCLFATAPDVLGDAVATWERSRLLLPEIRALGYRAALVAQNGIDQSPLEWSTFDVLFIGGNDTFKQRDATHALIREAKRRGKWVHFGRVNSFRRLRSVHLLGCDSADGTRIKYRPDYWLPIVRRWLDDIHGQLSLPLAVGAHVLPTPAGIGAKAGRGESLERLTAFDAGSLSSAAHLGQCSGDFSLIHAPMLSLAQPIDKPIGRC